jgi:hypothetical protein
MVNGPFSSAMEHFVVTQKKSHPEYQPEIAALRPLPEEPRIIWEGDGIWRETKPPVQPRFGEGELTIDGTGGNIKKLGGLFDGTAKKESELDDPHFSLIHRFELLQSTVESE